MNLNCIKWWKFASNNNNTKIKLEIERKFNPQSHCMDCGLAKTNKRKIILIWKCLISKKLKLI